MPNNFSKSQLRKLTIDQLQSVKQVSLEIGKTHLAEVIDSIITEKQNPKFFNVKPGRRTKDWNKARKVLKKESLEINIVTCEFQFPGCWGEADGYSHPVKKSRGGKDEGCLLSCNFCHNQVESAKDKIELHDQARARRINRIYQGV